MLSLVTIEAAAQRTHKPPLHGQDWMAVTGKPLAATAGAKIFIKGGNAIDAAVAMLGATCTMWDTLHWGGETQALIYNPRTGKVIGINGLGVAPSGATPEFFKSKGMAHPPPYGPLAAVTPGTPGGLMLMLAEYGTMSLAEVLEPAIRLAEGFPIEAQLANYIGRQKKWILQWPDSRRVMLPNPNDGQPEPGQIFRQPDLAATLRKLVDAERAALAAGRSRKEAIYAAHERFYRGDIAKELVAAVRAQGGLFTEADLANWKPAIEEPVSTSYRGIDVYKLTHWTQGPMMLQALNMLEGFDLKSMGYNSTRYIHTVYQAMSMAFADRDFYYGDPAFPPAEPILGLLSKDYARSRAAQIDPKRNDARIGPGDPYPFQRSRNPYVDLLKRWHEPRGKKPVGEGTPMASSGDDPYAGSSFYAGTTSVVAADKEGWVVSITPSGGWVPGVIAGRTGIGLSQRMQSFVLDAAENPFNVVAPGKRPRVTLTPSMALKDGKPYLAFAVQGGDGQEQDSLQFFLNVVEFGMTPQQAVEAATFHSSQLRESFEIHESKPGHLLLNELTPPWVRNELRSMGYTLTFRERTMGPVNAIMVDPRHGTFWGASGNHGEDYGIGW
ncbi:MAG TPA: gamma-glutamyltransferase family protein [Usitatibacter sp.]|nr:gamma-glutamyltransferase family protein [Usitatibacter sp.]